MGKTAGYTIAGLLGAILLIAGTAIAAVTSLFSLGSGPSQAALADIPPGYLALYQQASADCPGLDWSILAAIGKVETDHGRLNAPGVTSGENFAGAGGPMQFLAATFAGVTARHPLPPGGATPPSRYNPHDAIHAAAFYLCDSGARDGRDLHAAMFAYNHAEWYVQKILAQAEKYRAAATNRPSGPLRSTWPPEQATMPDPTSAGRVTPRTFALVQALRTTGLAGGGIGCNANRPANPNSDHPQGKACDVMFNPRSPASVTDGWHLTTWLIANQATLGVHYLIWQGQYWSAEQPTWTTYRSTAYGCPNPANLTGCHYDHIHISMY